MGRWTKLLVCFSAAVIVASATETVTVNVGEEVPLMVMTAGSVVDGCFILTPHKETIEFKPQNNSIENRYVLLEPNVMTECQVTVTVIDEKDSGEWTIYFTSAATVINEVKKNVVVNVQEVSISDSQSTIQLTKGEVLPLIVNTVGLDFDGCFVATPQNEIIEFKPIDKSSDDRFQLLEDNLMSQCQVQITVADENDSGTWSIFITKEDERIKEESYTVSVEITESGEDNGVVTTHLTRINYIVRPDMEVELSLRKIEQDVSCELRTPTGDHEDNNNNPQVRVIKSDDNPYAACRVLIGPIDDSLLGDWELCQKYNQNDQVYADCLPATLAWNSGNPSGHWENFSQESFEHVVNFNGTLTTGVTESGTMHTCHVITPDGNDIVVNEDSGYPFITRLTPVSKCSVSIGPINSQVFGDWVVYSIYSGFQGVTERRLPIHMVLYNPDNPYEQAYNVTNLNPVIRIVHLGTSIDLEVNDSVTNAQHNGCSLRGPDGSLVENNVSEITSVNVNSRIACHYRIDSISESLLGEWTVSLKYEWSGMFTEVRQVFFIQREDPSNPIIDEERPIEYHPAQHITTRLGSTHQFSIDGTSSRPIESCHVRTPDGLQYTVMDGFHIPGVEATFETLRCSVKIEASSTAMVGEWMLIARRPAIMSVPASEERLNFTIIIEDITEAVPKEITIFENKDFLVRLAEATDLHETCKLHGPDGNEYHLAEKDPNHPEQCGFLVRGVTKNMNGTWQIVYGDGITYRAHIDVAVHPTSDDEFPPLTWNFDDQFNEFIGPENIVYCTVRDPRGIVVFNNFGRCKIDINRVNHRHNGTWVANVGFEGKILLEDHEFPVIVRGIQAESTPPISTSVETSQAGVDLLCTVTTSTEMDVCKFQHDSGKVLIPTIGVSEGKYSFFGNGSSIVSGGYENNCGIRISNPTEEDWGTWRCAVSTEDEVHYGFLSAMNPNSVRNLEPVLTVTNIGHQAFEGEEVLVSCNIMRPIQYCYFRNQNGTVLNLNPGSPLHGIEYFGAGLAAGECGIKLNSVTTGDSGLWTCNIGLADHPEEKSQIFQLTVSEHLMIEQYDEFGRLVLKATVAQYTDQAVNIEHCRYVRIDGFAFTSENIQTEMLTEYSTSVSNNMCYLYINSPTILDHHPWAVTVRIQGHHEEYSGTSIPTLPGSHDNISSPGYTGTSFIWFWIAIVFTMMTVPVIAVILTPRERREWTYKKFNTFRNSFRSNKAPIPPPLPITYDVYNLGGHVNETQEEKTPQV